MDVGTPRTADDSESRLASLDKEKLEREAALTADFSARIDAMAEEKAATEARLGSEMARTREEHDVAIAEMRGEYEALSFRFETRESRSEDIERIAHLEQEAAEARERLGTQEERMRILKEEMRNREESYNVKFAADPRVMSGADSLSWMKPKKTTGSKVNDGASGGSIRQASARSARRSSMY